MTDAFATEARPADDSPEVVAFCRLASPGEASIGPVERLRAHLADRPDLEQVGTAPVVGIVAEPAGREPDQLEAAVRRRHEFLTDLAGDLPTIPVRWGCRIPSVEWLTEHIDRTRETLDRAFERVGGCRELVVRVPRASEASGSGSAEDANGAVNPGRQYLQQRSRSLTREPGADDPQLSRWQSTLQRVVRDSRALVQPADACRWYGPRHLEITLLFRSSRHAELLEVVRASAPDTTGSSVAITEPFPPYSFVDIDWPEPQS